MTTLAVGPGLAWVIQMHWGGQTFAQMLHEVQRTLPSESSYTSTGRNRNRSYTGNRSSGYSTVNSPSVLSSWRTVGCSPRFFGPNQKSSN